MNRKLNLGNILEQAIGGVIGAAFVASVVYVYNLVTGKSHAGCVVWVGLGLVAVGVLLAFAWRAFRRFLNVLGRMALAVLRWLLNNWQLVIGLTLLFGVAYGAYTSGHTFWDMFLAFSLALAVLLLARYRPKPWTLTILSGEAGEFSHTGDGPWKPPVLCEPLHPAWQVIEGAKWVWIKDRPTDQEAQQGQTVWHRLSFQLPQSTPWLCNAKMPLMVDDYVEIRINGKHARKITMDEGVAVLDVAAFLRPGSNAIEMQIQNKPYPAETGLSNPTGIIYRLDIRWAH